ncbi:uncharacterized protein FOMMEDRAFT_138779 [Fomitiporia mediterranea MF3/22]|uniref:uncharacterized protein n=1 Tax=Fomitiporia mediterranea (strain MF3/22) TaxID=694068 RepID=UPI0004409C74|nr:uncharacterized protein FOMMEDRAFT_138779 [Fomitiporia mediterranea MF3/22]EJD07113.1 hypothetical protein FOMMEDRAFT_138779 [Fomitiporia mediterranea MF3/22]
MDVDSDIGPLGTGDQHVNAQAGPSSQPVVPVVFLPPRGPSPRKPPLESTQDLILRFQLLRAYDKYVRPYAHPASSSGSQSSSTNPISPVKLVGFVNNASTPGALDKGKGREVPLPAVASTPMGAATPGVDGGDGDDGEEDGAKGDKKQKNSYRHLIKGIPGKHSTKKDDYLQTMMLVPPKQRMDISKFDTRTQRDAFAVNLDGLKGWNINALVAESAQAREDRKKRKELKKLAKAQAQAAQAGISLSGPLSAVPTSAAPTPGVRQPQTPASVGVGTPRPQGPGPGPPGHATTPSQTSGFGPPRSATPNPRPGIVGKKRELDDDGIQNGNIPAKRPPPGSGGSKPGVPRPAKRPRTDGTPHQMSLPSIPQQQPTPQGV